MGGLGDEQQGDAIALDKVANAVSKNTGVAKEAFQTILCWQNGSYWIICQEQKEQQLIPTWNFYLMVLCYDHFHFSLDYLQEIKKKQKR